MDTLCMLVSCGHLDRKIASAAQIYNALKTACSAVEHPVFEFECKGLGQGILCC